MRALLLALLALAALPGLAGAATEVYAGPKYLQITGSDGGDELTIEADGDQHVRVHDPGGVSGCEAVDETTVRCAAHVCCQWLLIDLRAGDDVLRIGDGMNLDVHAWGREGDDVLTGGQFKDELQGGAGADRLAGGDGPDLLAGGEGDDQMDGGAGTDQLAGGPGRDLASYATRTEGVRVWLDPRGASAFGAEDHVEADAVEGGAGPDVIIGSDNADTLHGNGGADRISGGRGPDLLHGGEGDDVVLGDGSQVESPGPDPAAEGGDDLILGGAGDDALRGDAGRDVIDGEAGDDAVDAREATQTWEVRDEVAACGDGFDRALLDHNDGETGCEEVQVRERPRPAAPPPAAFVPPTVPQGPGPQPPMGVPFTRGRAVVVPFHCHRAGGACTARVRVREARGRRRVLARGSALVGAGAAGVVRARLARGARRGRVIVELRLGRQRWVRPLTLGS